MSRKIDGVSNVYEIAQMIEAEEKRPSVVDLIKNKFKKLSKEVLEAKRFRPEDVGVVIIGPNLVGEMLKVDNFIDEDTVLVELLKSFPEAQLEAGEKIKLKLDHSVGSFQSDRLADDSRIEVFISATLRERLFYAQKRYNDSGHAIGFDHYGFRS